MESLKSYHLTIFLVTVVIWTGCTKKVVKNVENISYIPKKEHTSLLIDAKRDLLYGSSETAETKLLEILHQDSFYHSANYELGKIYYAKGDFSNAEYYSGKAYQLKKNNQFYSSLYINSLLKNNKINVAIPLIFKLIELDSKNIEIYFDVIDLFSEYGLYREMLKVIDIFEKRFGYSDEIIVSKCQIYLKKGKIKEVLKYLNRVKEVDSNRVIVYLLLGDIYSSLGDTKQSIKNYYYVLNLEPNNLHANKEIIKLFLKDGQYNFAFNIFENNIINSTIDVNDKISILLDLFSYSEKFNNELKVKIENFITTLNTLYSDNPGISYLYGELMYRKKEFNSAINSFEVSLNFKPDNLELWNLTIYLCYQVKDYERLIKLATSALKYYPNIRDLYMLRGYAFLNLDSLLRSYDDFLSALKLTGSLDKTKIDILHALAEVTHRLKRNIETYSYYEEILKESPNDIVALNNYAYFLSLEKKDLDKALEMSLKTIKVEPKNPTYLDTYAYILFVLGRFEEALKYIELAILYGGGQNGTILEHYGDILFFNNQIEDALMAWKEAFERGGGSKYLPIKIERKEYVE